VDLHPVLADGDGFLRGDVTSDGVHLNAKGYEAVIQRLKEAGVWPMSED
jgi:lysophospholipase L1-like esterase